MYQKGYIIIIKLYRYKNVDKEHRHSNRLDTLSVSNEIEEKTGIFVSKRKI